MNKHISKATALLFFLFLLLGSASADQADSTKAMLEQMEDLQETIEFKQPRDYSTVRYANGKTATILFNKRGATWYWPNGKTITIRAGVAGATWLWPNGKTMSIRTGKKGATWYWPDGSVFTTSGPEVSDYELLDVPAYAVKMLRMAKRRGY